MKKKCMLSKIRWTCVENWWFKKFPVPQLKFMLPITW